MSHILKYFTIFMLSFSICVEANSFTNNSISLLPMIVAFITITFFMLIWPQRKIQKQHRELLQNLYVGTEVKLTSGIVGTITVLYEQYVVMAISGSNTITIDKNAIATILPKGSIQAIS